MDIGGSHRSRSACEVGAGGRRKDNYADGIAHVSIGTDGDQNDSATEEVTMGETTTQLLNILLNQDEGQHVGQLPDHARINNIYIPGVAYILPKFPGSHSFAERYHEYRTAEYFDAFLEWALAPIITREGAAKVELTSCFLWLMPSVLLSQLQSAAPPPFSRAWET